jgi:predicted phage-related endonuclease
LETHELIQGSADWHAYRAEHNNASDAPAMLGVSPYKSRTELLHERATGIAKDINPVTQALFNDGHRFEALSRELAESIVGEPLYPVTGSAGKLSASFDGLTMMEHVVWEHKSLNADIRAAETVADLGLHLHVQMEQQLLVSGAEKCLFLASKWNEQGELVEEKHFWYFPNLELRASIVAGWDQFEKDVAEYVPVAAEVKPLGQAPETLPALSLEVIGEVTASNLGEFKAHALAVFAGINRELTTDQHFADAEKAVKWCEGVEDRLAAAKEHALSKMASIDLLFKTIDDISAEARRVRLDLFNLVSRRKVEMKESIVMAGKAAYQLHLDALRTETENFWITLPTPDFAGVAKGKRNFDSMKDAVNTLLANAKVEADASAKRIRANLTTLKDKTVGFEFLFSDRAALVGKQPDDLTLVIDSRIAAHKNAEEARLDADRKRIAEEERIKAEATVRAEQEAERKRIEAAEAVQARPAPAVPSGHINDAINLVHPARPAARPSAAFEMPKRQASVGQVPASLKLGQIAERLGFTLTADFLKTLGFEPAATDRASKLYHEADFPSICAALISHISQVQEQQAA